MTRLTANLKPKMIWSFARLAALHGHIYRAGLMVLLLCASTHSNAQTDNSILGVSTGMNEAAAKKSLEGQGYKLTGILNYNATPSVPSHTGEMVFEKGGSTLRVKLSQVPGRVMYLERKDYMAAPVLQDALYDSLIKKYGRPTSSYNNQQRLEWRYSAAGQPVTDSSCKFLTNISRDEALHCGISIYATTFGNPTHSLNMEMWDYRVQEDDIKSQDQLDDTATTQGMNRAKQAPLPKL